MLTRQLSEFVQGKLCRVRSGIRTLFATSPDLDPASSETRSAPSTPNSGRHYPSQTLIAFRAFITGLLVLQYTDGACAKSIKGSSYRPTFYII